MMNMKGMITVPSPTRWNYYITDHLGSTRMVVGSNDSIVIGTHRNGRIPFFNSRYSGTCNLRPGTANFEYKKTLF